MPQGTNLFGNHVSLERVKASNEFLVPLLNEVGKGTPKRDLHLLASVMRKDEIHPEIREKLDAIAESLNPSRIATQGNNTDERMN